METEKSTTIDNKLDGLIELGFLLANIPERAKESFKFKPNEDLYKATNINHKRLGILRKNGIEITLREFLALAKYLQIPDEMAADLIFKDKTPEEIYKHHKKY